MSHLDVDDLAHCEDPGDLHARREPQCESARVESSIGLKKFGSAPHEQRDEDRQAHQDEPVILPCAV
jgi:hypothetical protein